MQDIILEIRSNRKLADKMYEMVLYHAQRLQERIMPGQFINLKLDGYYLRRPISICSWTEDTITVIYKTAGRGTEAMSRYEKGRKLNALAPLGTGFDISKSGARPLLAGGGAGVPPIYGLCKTLLAEGKRPIVVLGFHSAPEIFYADEFHALGADVIIATADGSRGVKGFVTDALDASILESMGITPYTYFYACGPEPMLKALDSSIALEIGGQMSFEKRMGCGFGACMGCSCKTKHGTKRICKEGPVLERSEILW